MKTRGLVITLSALIVLMSLVARPAEAYWSHATAWNSSGECARVQFFMGKRVTGGTGPHYQPAFLLRPGAHRREPLGGTWATGKLPIDVASKPYQVVARFEIFPTAACTGSPVGRNYEKSATDSNPFNGRTWNVRLLGGPGRYRLQ